MESYCVRTQDVERKFKAAPRVRGFGHLPDGYSDYKGCRVGLEFVIRLSCRMRSCVEVVGDQEHEVGFPHVLVRMPGVYHESRIPVHRHVFFFTYPPETVGIFGDMGLTFPRPCWDITITPRIRELIRLLDACSTRSHELGVCDRVDILCLELVQELVLVDEGQVATCGPDEDAVRAIASYIHLHYNEKLSVDQLIRGSGLSRRSFFRHWKKYFNLTPTNYIMDLKIQEAKRLLIETDLRVDAIAEELNFLSSTYFCRIFKRMTGTSPRRHRETRGNTDA